MTADDLKSQLDRKRGEVADEVKDAEAARDTTLAELSKSQTALDETTREHDAVTRQFQSLIVDYQKLDVVYKNAEKQLRSQAEELRAADIKKGQLDHSQDMLRLASHAIDEIFDTLPSSSSRDSRENEPP